MPQILSYSSNLNSYRSSSFIQKHDDSGCTSQPGSDLSLLSYFMKRKKRRKTSSNKGQPKYFYISPTSQIISDGSLNKLSQSSCHESGIIRSNESISTYRSMSSDSSSQLNPPLLKCLNSRKIFPEIPNNSQNTDLSQGLDQRSFVSSSYVEVIENVDEYGQFVDVKEVNDEIERRIKYHSRIRRGRTSHSQLMF